LEKLSTILSASKQRFTVASPLNIVSLDEKQRRAGWAIKTFAAMNQNIRLFGSCLNSSISAALLRPRSIFPDANGRAAVEAQARTK